MVNKLILTVGLPRSGKSTWAKSLVASGGSLNVAIVNPDSIRLALHGQMFLKMLEPLVWFITRVMIKALFLAGHQIVILDATNISEASRAKWISPEWETGFKVFPTDKETCIRRAIDGGRDDLVPVIENMAAFYEPLTEIEEDLKALVNL